MGKIKFFPNTLTLVIPYQLRGLRSVAVLLIGLCASLRDCDVLPHSLSQCHQRFGMSQLIFLLVLAFHFAVMVMVLG